MATYCRECFAELPEVTTDTGQCANCGTVFTPGAKGSYRERPFPRKREIFAMLVVTTLIAVIVAFGVAFHQAAMTSGH